MNFKITTYVLTVLLVGALIFAFYMQKQARQHEAKYEAAIIDAQNAVAREQKLEQQLEKALQDSETHRKQAEEALAELQKRKK
jgi:septal ring factor EnvC (AmiA/AmiB activator)